MKVRFPGIFFLAKAGRLKLLPGNRSGGQQRFFAVLGLICGLTLNGCQTPHDPFDTPWYHLITPSGPGFSDTLSPHVILTNHVLAFRCSILISDMKLPYQILPQRPVAYSPDASGTIFVGYHFPVDKLKEIMTFARNYYTGSRYVELSDPNDRSQKYSLHYALVLGATTDRALTQGLEVWTDADFKKIASMTSQEELRSFIRSKMNAEKVQVKDFKPAEKSETDNENTSEDEKSEDQQETDTEPERKIDQEP